ncbi:REP-associated tyrosine transposase [wastewater metagenome]|uniref:REP-associated tyrosine transposase n=2 Tax=unclassified sequences TaxID=12908 RepID=A0A5B8RH01_9ZZZZ|nr:transposase [Arhodomonas sp. KWT]QEA07881.1 REP-associated tyrosine transposase [uncultured organism]
MEYRRAHVPGGCYFFTVVTRYRRPLFCDDGLRRLLGAAIRAVARYRPFRTEAIVLLPDHLHCMWSLPRGDPDFSGRWRLIKRYVSTRAGDKRIWQPRFWEHRVRNDVDFRHHLDYIHYNPVKHGFVTAPGEWAWSSFHRFVRAGVYAAEWGTAPPDTPDRVGRE